MRNSPEIKQNKLLSPELRLILDAKHHDPFSALGFHGNTVSVFLPHAEKVQLASDQRAFERIEGTDAFILHGEEIPADYKLLITDKNGQQFTAEDPYRFPTQLGELDLHLFNEGKHSKLYEMLGAHVCETQGICGTRFSVWAPAATRVSVVGDFNQWDGRVHSMRSRGSSGVWEIFLPQVSTGAHYKFEIRNANGDISVKQDPYANEFEFRPATASIVNNSDFFWQDDDWIKARRESNWLRTPCSIYEVHLGSWQRTDDNLFLDYQTLAHRLVEYVRFMGFTHIELLPITEHPLDDSWGYQVTGYFAPSSRFGTPDEFRYFVNHCHEQGIGVILDWVPAHFPRDAHSLARYDGTGLYEHEDPRQGEHRDWGTLIFNYGRNEVRNFLIASALYWLEEFHLDGLRVDAVASMLYLDYSREPGDWLPNQYGGRENLEAVDFLRELNTVTQTKVPGSVIIAEESTSWPQVSRPAEHGGLGFNMKWNMGWMHDSLSYMDNDPIHRKHHHNKLTFGLLYLFTENFVLPFSHDEVVHGKGSMLTKMSGDDWQQFANLRLLYAYQFTYPGKKLLFQGLEFAQRNEWNFEHSLDWYLADVPAHRGIMTLVSDLNRLYQQHPALFECDFEENGFEWINADDDGNSVLSYKRHSIKKQETLIVLLNFTPVPRSHYCIGVDASGSYIELFNSDSDRYGGGNYGNYGTLLSYPENCMQHANTLSVNLPPLAAVILKYVSTGNQ